MRSKVLHVGWGFSPWRGGGLIEYAEDLMKIEAQHGYQVYYFFSGRHYPFLKRSRLIKWRRKNINMYEIINSPIIHEGGRGVRDPALDLNEPVSENFFRKTLEEIMPDILHIQELAGLPSSLIDIAKEEYRIPVVMTLHDYFLLCPTLKLLDYLSKNCVEKEAGDKCTLCCSVSRKNNPLIESTLLYELRRCHLEKIVRTAYRPFKIIIRGKGNNISIRGSGIIFQNRRDTNVNRLRKVDLLIAQSYRVEKIYKSFLGEDANTTTLHSAVKHIEYIRGKEMRGIKSPVRFATLSGCDSIPKGARLILESLKILHGKGLGRYFEFHIYGDLLEEIRGQVLSYSNVFYHGKYGVDQLNNILDRFDVGIVPSVWEEVYGYVGIEFLAKGIPIIGNMRGGIIDYTIGGLTGWVNKTVSAEELSDIMARIIKNPEEIAMLNEKILQNRSRLIKTIDTHFDEIDKLYRGVR